MKTAAAIFTAALLPLAAAPALAETRAERNEARVAERLEGREAGEPVSCIFAPRSHGLEVIEHVGILYEAGDTIYLARVVHPRSLGFGDALIIQRRGSSLCKHDMTRTFDRGSQINGVVFFEDFVPYTDRGDG